jgi:type I restriction enzyme S subunit
MIRQDWAKCVFEDLLAYEQPAKYIVKSTKYDPSYPTPVLTAGKTFIKGYTDEKNGIFNNLPVIIFDDFTTANQFVNFSFKVKSSAMKILKPVSKLVNLKFLFFFMQANPIRNDTHKRYWISVYAKKELLLPSFTEQRAIVAKIEELFSSLDSGIEDLKKVQKQLKIYRQAVLKKAFEGELTREWREKQTDLPTAKELSAKIKEERQNYYKKQLEEWKHSVKVWEKDGKVGKKPSKPKNFNKSESLKKTEVNNFPILPQNWFWERIGLFFSSLDQGWSPKCENFPAKKGDWGVIKTTAIQPGFFDEESNKNLPLNLSPRKQHELKDGDILITRAGPRKRVGICCLVKNVRPKLINCDKAYRIRLKFGSPNFIVYLLNSPEFANELEKTKSGINDSGLNLKQDIFLRMPIPVCSVKEQNQIVKEIESRLSVCEKVEETITESLEKAEALRQSILKKAFAGKLLSEEELAACKKEKDYMPASELLKKIKDEKQGKEKKK